MEIRNRPTNENDISTTLGTDLPIISIEKRGKSE